MYYLTTIDVLEYLVKRNSENILLNDYSDTYLYQLLLLLEH